MSEKKVVVGLVKDLMTREKLRAGGEELQIEWQFARTAERFLELCAELQPRKVVIDLGNGEEFRKALPQLREKHPFVHSIAFGSHVETDLFAEAEELGITESFARSSFFAHLPSLF